MHELKITISIRVDDDQGNEIFQHSQPSSQWIDNGELLKKAGDEFYEWIRGYPVRVMYRFFDALIDRIRDSVICGEQPNPEFPEHMRGPAPKSMRWDEPISSPAYVPGEIMPLHGAQSRAPSDLGSVRPQTFRQGKAQFFHHRSIG